MLCFLLSFHLKLTYEHGTIGICRCDKVSYPIQRPFFCDPKFYLNPPRSLQLPTYANDIANQLAGGSYHTFTSKYHPGRVLEFCIQKLLNVMVRPPLMQILVILECLHDQVITVIRI